MKKLAIWVLLSLSLCTVANATTWTEDFEGAFPVWEHGWLGQNSNLTNYYGFGSKYVSDRGNNPDGLWFWNRDIIFSSDFGASLASFSLDIAGYADTNLQAYDKDNNLVFDSSVALTKGAFTDPGVYSRYTITSTNGISHILFTSSNASGNTSIDNIVASDGNANQPVPEPSTFILLGAGLAGLAYTRKRFAKK